MIEFLIVLEETDGSDNDLTGRQASKIFRHPTIPDIGHQVIIDGNGYPVREIEHWLGEPVNERDPPIRVLVPWSRNDFESLWNDDLWHKENFG